MRRLRIPLTSRSCNWTACNASSRPRAWGPPVGRDESAARDGRKVRGRRLLVSSATPRPDRGRTAAIHDAPRPQRTTRHPPGPPRRGGDLAQEPCPIAFQNGGNPVKSSSRTRRFDRRDPRIAIPLPGQTAPAGVNPAAERRQGRHDFGTRPSPYVDQKGLPGLRPHACPGPPRRRSSAHRQRAVAGGPPRGGASRGGPPGSRARSRRRRPLPHRPPIPRWSRPRTRPRSPSRTRQRPPTQRPIRPPSIRRPNPLSPQTRPRSTPPRPHRTTRSRRSRRPADPCR